MEGRDCRDQVDLGDGCSCDPSEHRANQAGKREIEERAAQQGGANDGPGRPGHVFERPVNLHTEVDIGRLQIGIANNDFRFCHTLPEGSDLHCRT